MKKLRLKFVDFWTDMNKPEGNYFYEILSRRYDVEFSDDPEIIIFSNYGNEYLKYKCTRIFFSAENQKPDFIACDYAIGFEYLDDPRYLRFPLWALYYLGYIKWINVKRLDMPVAGGELEQQWKAKKKFCCFIVSNAKCKKRNDFFTTLNSVKPVDSAGRYLNNIGYFLEGGSVEKLDFIRDYKFVISFENESHPGYTTEKVFEPLLAGCIPIYWGNPSVETDFNKKRILHYDDFTTEKQLIQKILDIDSNDELAFDIVKEKCFTNGHTSIDRYEELLQDFLYGIVEQNGKTKPVAQKIFHSMAHKSKMLIRKVENRLIKKNYTR
jgi:hypothetical protein